MTRTPTSSCTPGSAPSLATGPPPPGPSLRIHGLSSPDLVVTTRTGGAWTVPPILPPPPRPPVRGDSTPPTLHPSPSSQQQEEDRSQDHHLHPTTAFLHFPLSLNPPCHPLHQCHCYNITKLNQANHRPQQTLVFPVPVLQSPLVLLPISASDPVLTMTVLLLLLFLLGPSRQDLHLNGWRNHHIQVRPTVRIQMVSFLFSTNQFWILWSFNTSLLPKGWKKSHKNVHNGEI